ncbi:hypothetical protein ABPG72_006502 [Tetrahymena utriculariae]
MSSQSSQNQLIDSMSNKLDELASQEQKYPQLLECVQSHYSLATERCKNIQKKLLTYGIKCCKNVDELINNLKQYCIEIIQSDGIYKYLTCENQKIYYLSLIAKTIDYILHLNSNKLPALIQDAQKVVAKVLPDTWSKVFTSLGFGLVILGGIGLGLMAFVSNSVAAGGSIVTASAGIAAATTEVGVGGTILTASAGATAEVAAEGIAALVASPAFIVGCTVLIIGGIGLAIYGLTKTKE